MASPKAQVTEKAPKAQATENFQTVPMVRSETDANGGPTTADVHPEEVENWRQHGWAIKETL